MTRCVSGNHHKQQYRLPPDGAPDKHDGSHFLTLTNKSGASRLSGDDPSLVTCFGCGSGRNGQENRSSGDSDWLSGQSSQEIQEGYRSGVRASQTRDFSSDTRTSTRDINPRPLQTQVRSFGTNPRTPVASKKLTETFSTTGHRERDTELSTTGHLERDTELSTTGHLERDTELTTTGHPERDTELSYVHMGARQSALKSPNGDVSSLCGVGVASSINGTGGGSHSSKKAHQPTLASCLSSDPSGGEERSATERSPPPSGNQDRRKIEGRGAQHDKTESEISEGTQAAFGSREQTEKKKVMLKDIGVQTSLELEGYAVDISSSLEDLHSSVELASDLANQSKISELETSGEMVHDKETGCISSGFSLTPNGAGSVGVENESTSSTGPLHTRYEQFLQRTEDQNENERRNFAEFTDTSCRNRGQIVDGNFNIDKRVSNSSNISFDRSSKHPIVRSKSLHEEVSSKDTESRRSRAGGAEGQGHVGGRQRAAGDEREGGPALSGSLHELRHLNIDVSQRLVDGQRRFVVVNGGSPDIQVVVNSLTPVLCRRRHRSGGARRVPIGQRWDDIDSRQLSSPVSNDRKDSHSRQDNLIYDTSNIEHNDFSMRGFSRTCDNSYSSRERQPPIILREVFGFASDFPEVEEPLPVYARLSSHDGVMEHPRSQDPNSPRKLTEEDFTHHQLKKKGIYQVSEELLLVSRKQPPSVSPAEHFSQKYALTTFTTDHRDSCIESGTAWRSADHDVIPSDFPPGMDDLAEELERSRHSLFLSPKLSHTWHGPSSDSVPSSQRHAPRMGLGLYFQEAASRNRVPYKNVRMSKSVSHRPMSAEANHSLQQASSRRSSGGIAGFYHGHTLPVISRTLLDAMHKRYCSHQYSPSLLQHLQPCSAHTIPTSPTTSHTASGPSLTSSVSRSATAWRIEPPANPRSQKVQAAPPSPQAMARLKQMLLEQQQLKQVRRRQDGHDGGAGSLTERRVEGREGEGRGPHGNSSRQGALPSLPQHVKARLLAVAQSQSGESQQNHQPQRLGETDLEASPALIKVSWLKASVFLLLVYHCNLAISS